MLNTILSKLYKIQGKLNLSLANVNLDLVNNFVQKNGDCINLHIQETTQNGQGQSTILFTMILLIM